MTDVAIRRPVFITMVFSGLMIVGLMAVDRLGVDLFPDVSFPIVSVQTVWPGASPTSVENDITDVIEEQVASINGVDKVRSYSRNSLSSVWIEFELDVDVQEAANDVRNKLAAARGQLPFDIEEPVVARIDPTALPVLTYAVSSPRSPTATRKWVDDVLRPALERLEGVAAINVQGGTEREIGVLVDRDRLSALSIPLTHVAQTLRAETVDLPSGPLQLGQREENLKLAGRFESLEEIRDMVVAQRGGSVVRVRDIATVVDGTEDVRSITQVDGVPSVTFSVQKQGGANTVAVVDLVEAELPKIQLPPGYKLTEVIDASDYIRINISHLWEHLIIGGIMAVLVIFLFMLDWRSTVISGLALPTSIMITFFVMWQLGFTLNIMSMLALTLSIGILIDDSVVVRENIFRHMEMGEDPVTAAHRGTSEIALAVLATTLTIVAVFVPVAFTGGLIGTMFKEFGLTVAAAVLISMLVSFTLDPMLSARMTKPIPPDYHERQRRKPVVGWIVRFYDGMDRVYTGLLKWTLRHRLLTVGASAAFLVGTCSLTPLMGQEFVARGDRGELSVMLDLPAGISLPEARARIAQAERLIAALPEHVTTFTTLGQGGQIDRATLRVELTSKDARARGIEEVMEGLRADLATIPGVEVYMRVAGLGEGSMEEAPITLEVRGPDYAQLAPLAREVLTVMRATPGVRDAAMTYRPGSKEQRLNVDREAASDLGVSSLVVAQTLRQALEGEVVTKLDAGQDDVDVRLRLTAAGRSSVAELGALLVPAARGGSVPIRDVTTGTSGTMPSTIERVDRGRQITITANVYERSLGEVMQDLMPRLEGIDRPAGYSYAVAGEAERMQETFTNLGLALALAIMFIYLVLASQFESFIHPFTIMMALPLAVIGALLALFLTGQSMGLASMIGMILLMGLVTKNSILLVDNANHLRREEGLAILPAILKAGETRLRPILMTSAAIVLGMLPAAMGTGEGSEFQAPMAIAVIGGVITSTLLTLLVVPVIYIWFDRLTFVGFKEWRADRRARKAARAERRQATA